MDLVEREQELAEFAGMLAECAEGHGNAAIISGGIGCGKTELLNAVKSRATQAGFLVLDAVGSWAERESRGSVLNQLLRYAGTALGADDWTAEPLERVGRPQVSGDTAEGERRTLDWDTTAALHQLCVDLLQIAEQTPVLICIDDVQFVDSLSQHWILQLLPRLQSSRIALFVGECMLSKPPDPQLRAALLRLPNYHRVPVSRLTEDGVATLLAQHVDAPTVAALAADCCAVSAGNPLLVRALVEDHRNAATSPTPTAPQLVVADAYADAVLSCLHRGRPVLMHLAQALAVLDEDSDVTDLLVRMLPDVEPATVERALSALDVAGLLDGRRLRHPVARAAVLESLTPQRRASMRRRAAELLYEEGAPAVRIAPHLLGAERDLHPWAVAVLREAAERHLMDNRASEAYACLEAALRLCEDDSLRVGLKALHASAAWLLNPSISVRHLGELTDALREGRLQDRHALMLAKYLLWHGRFDEAADAIERIGDRGADADPACAEIRATRELLSTTYPSLVSSETSRCAPGEPGSVNRRGADGDPRIRAAVALSYVLRHRPDDEAVAAAEASMRAMRLSKRTQEWLMCAVAALLFADRPDAAACWCDHWLDGARSRHVPLWEAEFASLRAAIALRHGDLAPARQLAEIALAQVPAESWGVCLGGPLSNLVTAATEAGDYDAAAAYLEVPVPDGMFQTRFGLYYLNARGRYHLEVGRPYAALDDFTACGDLMLEWGFDQPSVVPWRSEAASAYLLLGDVARASALAREQIAMVGTRQSRTRGISLRVLAATSRPADRADLLAEAVQILRACGDRLQLAGALADLGRLHYQLGRRTRAKPVVEMAARLAESCGAQPLLKALPVDGGGPAPDRPSGPGPVDPAAALILLSGAERRVASLAACGHTNREISQKLCITVSTVEQHLTRVFRKLGVKARKNLPEEIILDIQRDKVDLQRDKNVYQPASSGKGW
jgi:DNA-binding CsgD family transcriptional regulator